MEEQEELQPKKPVDPKKLAKLEKFKAKQAKLAEKAQAQNNDNASAKKPKKKKEEELYVDETPLGQKKDLSKPMVNAYQPKGVEAAWYAWWEECGFFKPQLNADGTVLSKGTYVIPIPPPNVTGALHLGHALTNSIQDALIRWHRMRGFTTLYIPGCDHAGIATQAVVEKKLMKQEGLSRHDLGREKFIERVWEWKQEYGDRIYKQLRRMGSSYDWTRACFTMDENFVKAVSETFVRLHNEGTIYRDNRLVNWCCVLNTALSNLKVDEMQLNGRTLMQVPGHDPNRKYEFGVIISFAYPIENSDEKIIVATTRIETMLGDVAIAVHPNDKRYAHLVGKYAVHPFNQRRIRIIADESVEIDFGTGCVKITPAHDPNDYAIGKKHGLEFINIFNDNGTINSNGAPFEGMKRFDARVAVLKALKEKGLYVETKDNPMVLPICSRSGDVIEPLIKPQWYVRCNEMANDAMEAVRDGRLKIQPKSSEKEWFAWLNNIQDWCISRQLWWGHRIPAYFVQIEGQDNEREDGKYWVSGLTLEDATMRAHEKFPEFKDKITLVQDEDVLDTWFSSGLWPFATLGWPDDTLDLERFYPNSLLETGWDILFFWVMRMVMMGIKLTGKVPFKEVFCHAMVRDAHGRKMSKSTGNVIDPIDVMEGCSLDDLHKQLEKGNLDAKKLEAAKAGQKKDYPNGIPECGTDALRFALCSYQGTNRDINLDILRVEGYRKFCNKLWNACRFALMKLGDDFKPLAAPVKDTSNLSLMEKWILHRLNKATEDLDKNMKEYNFMQATSAIHKFWLYELCDVYIELSKGVIDGTDEVKRESAKQTLYTCLERALLMMHPFMPFVTEELFQRLARRPGDTVQTIMLAPFPEFIPEWNDAEAEIEFDYLNQLAKASRSLLSDYTVKAPQIFAHVSEDKFGFVEKEQDTVVQLIFAQNVKFTLLKKNEHAPPGCAPFPISDDASVSLLVRGCVDLDAEIEKLRQKLEKSELNAKQMKERMESDEYSQKVKQSVQEAEAVKLKNVEAEIETIQKGILNFEKLKG